MQVPKVFIDVRHIVVWTFLSQIYQRLPMPIGFRFGKLLLNYHPYHPTLLIMSCVFLYMIYYQLNNFHLFSLIIIFFWLYVFFISSYNNIWTYFIILYYRLPGRDTKSVQSIQNMEVNFIKLFFHTMPVICDNFFILCFLLSFLMY